MTTRPSLPVEQYQVGIVCALRHEMTAAIAILDERHQPIAGQDRLDPNNYVVGRVHEHNVVIACLPAGVYGTNAAARVANDMLRTFTGLRFGLMVGIGGGIPNLPKGLDIRLGDVVVSQPDKTFGGVVQYDLRKNLGEGHYESKGFLKAPPTILLAALSTLQAEHDLEDSKMPVILAKAFRTHPNLMKNGYGFPGRETDTLYCSRCDNNGSSSTCSLCTGGRLARPAREDHKPALWYGTIASGNELIKNAGERDRLGQEYGALCVEMEAAGLMNDFPCLVIRGVCDYADSRKNDGWQKYAALVAAAYTKELLGYVSPEQTAREERVQDIVVSLTQHLDKQSRLAKEHLNEVQREHVRQDRRYHSEKHHRCHQTFKVGPYEAQKDLNPNRVAGTCQWVLTHPRYLRWLNNPHDDLLWISADPGCGKSVLAKSLIDHELQTKDRHTVCYFFFKDNEEQDHVATALCALLHQLFSYQPGLIPHAMSIWEKNGDKVVKEVAELWRILVAAGHDEQAHDVTCVLDALDECRPADQRWLIDMLSRFHTRTSTSLSATRRGRLKFLVISRPYNDIQVEFQKTLQDLPMIRLRGEEENDQIHQEIDLVIRMRVGQLATDLKLDEDTEAQLETRLLKMEHRTYLWLYLAIDSIRQTYRKSLRRKQALVTSLPASVEEAYEKILSRVGKEQRDDIRKIFQIVIGARRPLHVEEMAVALGIATSTNSKSLDDARLDPISLKASIRDWCGLFIFFNHDRIHLIHQTAKEFLMGENGGPDLLSGWKHCLNPRETEREMTRICVEYLAFDSVEATAQPLISQFRTFTKLDELLEKGHYVQNLLVYAAEHWPSHLREAYLTPDDPVVYRVLELYQVENKLYKFWFRIFWQATRSYNDFPQMSPVRLGGLLGHADILKLILDRQETDNINKPDRNGRTALIWASEYGHEKVVEMLLDRGADVNAQGGHYGNALQAASEGGHEKVVEMLLDRGADFNAQGGHYGHALQAASEGGHEKVVEILLDRGADINAQGGHYGHALQAASEGGHEKVVEILLDRGADVNAQGGEYGNALQAASEGGHEKVVEMLLDRGADVNAQGGEYGNAA